MKKIFFLLLIAMVVFGCGKNDKKIVNSGSGKQTVVTNTTNDSQSNEVVLKKKRNFKGIVSPFTTKSPLEGIWFATFGEGASTSVHVVLIQKVYDENYTKKLMEMYYRINRYDGDYDSNSKTVVYKWRQYGNGKEATWEINDLNENNSVFKITNPRNGNRIETWLYNSSNDTVQRYIGANNANLITFKRYNKAEFQRIKDNIKDTIVRLSGNTNIKFKN